MPQTRHACTTNTRQMQLFRLIRLRRKLPVSRGGFGLYRPEALVYLQT